jgi:hypothetical protein
LLADLVRLSIHANRIMLPKKGIGRLMLDWPRQRSLALFAGRAANFHVPLVSDHRETNKYRPVVPPEGGRSNRKANRRVASNAPS